MAEKEFSNLNNSANNRGQMGSIDQKEPENENLTLLSPLTKKVHNVTFYDIQSYFRAFLKNVKSGMHLSGKRSGWTFMIIFKDGLKQIRSVPAEPHSKEYDRYNEHPPSLDRHRLHHQAVRGPGAGAGEGGNCWRRFA
jgi:hypothetical protein